MRLVEMARALSAFRFVFNPGITGLISIDAANGSFFLFEIKVVGRDIDTLELNVCYADNQGRPIKQELNADLQAEFSRLLEEAPTTETAVITPWAFKGFHLYMQPKRSRGQWRWLLTCPLLSLAISRGLLDPIIAKVGLSSKYLRSCETVCNAIFETLLLLYSKFQKPCARLKNGLTL